MWEVFVRDVVERWSSERRRIGSKGAFGVAERGGMGSGFVFSSVPKGSSASVEASDMYVEMRDCGREEEG